MAYSFKGNISFGLVYIPITLTTCVKTNDIDFNWLDRKTKSRVQYLKTCEECQGKVLKQEDLVRGFEYEKNKYVILEEKDFEKIKSKKDKEIKIECFVDEKEIDTIYYNKTYYVHPSGAENAYFLLATALKQTKKVGIAKCVIGNKENLVALRFKDHYLLLNTLFFKEDILPNPIEKNSKKVDEKQLKLAKALIENMIQPFNPDLYHNEYKEKIKEAIEKKISGKEITSIRQKKENQMLDLFEALQNSIKNQKKETKKTPIIRTKKSSYRAEA